MTCLVLGCSISGNHKFVVSFSKAAASPYQTITLRTTSETPNCKFSDTEAASVLEDARGMGSVKTVAGKQTVRVLTPAGNNNKLTRTTTKTVSKGTEKPCI